MVNQRLLRVFELVARLVGVALVIVGGAVALSAPIYGVPVVAVGLLFALKPRIAAELLDFAASLV